MTQALAQRGVRGALGGMATGLQHRQVASTQKLVTAMVVLEHGSLDRKVVISSMPFCSLSMISASDSPWYQMTPVMGRAVIATQNPIGSAGTQMLPESQLDRFMVCMTMGYPDVENEIAILKDRGSGNPIENIVPVIQAQELVQMQKETEQVFIHDVIYTYIAKLIAATRENPYLELGVSPRGTIAVTRMAKAAAYLEGRNYVTPNDVCMVLKDVSMHRIKLNARARVNHVTTEGIMDEILEKVPKPTPKRK